MIRRLAAVTWLTVACLAVPAHATVLREMGLAELSSEADHVVVARAIEKRSRWEGRRIVTDVTMVVSETAKGPAKVGERVIVTVMGGSVDGIGMKVIGEARFRVGEDCLVFLIDRGFAAAQQRRTEVVG